MPVPNSLRALRETWIARLNAFPSLQSLSINFEDTPPILAVDLSTGASRGYVAVGEERDTNATVIEAQLITTVIAGSLSGKAALDLVDAARVALLQAAMVSAEDRFGLDIELMGYAGSTPANDGEGRRIYSARHFFFNVRYVNPLAAVF